MQADSCVAKMQIPLGRRRTVQVLRIRAAGVVSPSSQLAFFDFQRVTELADSTWVRSGRPAWRIDSLRRLPTEELIYTGRHRRYRPEKQLAIRLDSRWQYHKVTLLHR